VLVLMMEVLETLVLPEWMMVRMRVEAWMGAWAWAWGRPRWIRSWLLLIDEAVLGCAVLGCSVLLYFVYLFYCLFD